MLVDTHCHLNFSVYDGDREEVVNRARAAGVQQIINPGIDLETSREAIRLADLYEEVYAAVGVHPNDASGWDAGTLPALRELCQHPKVVAVGEIGLDYYRDRTPHGLQIEVFRAQLSLAAEVGRPVIIHSRDADPQDRQATRDVLRIITEWQAELAADGSSLAERPGVLHSFAGEPTQAQQAVRSGFRIGITGPVTFRNGQLAQTVAASVPFGSLLAETDAPFLTPHPHRGRRNEPAYVGYVVKKIAQIHAVADEAAEKITSSNAERLFLWQVRNNLL